MKKFKRLTALVLAAVLLVSMLAACSKGNGDTLGSSTVSEKTPASSTASKADEKEPEVSSAPEVKEQTITYSFWGDKNEAGKKQELAEQYMSEHPGITIKMTYTDGGTYPTKLQSYFASNTAPDVISLSNNVISEFIGKGFFEDLTPYMERDGLLSDTWEQSLLDAYTYDGKIIAAPFVYKTFAIVYNKSIFDQAGVAYPKEGWTEKEFLDLAAQLTKGEGVEKTYGVYLSSWMLQECLLNFYKDANPYDFVNNTMTAEGNEGYKAALTMMTNLLKSGYAPSTAETTSIGGGFETGRFAMAYTAPWDMGGFNTTIADSFDWGVVQMPQSETYGQWQNPLRVDGIAVSAASENKEAAWDFVKWSCAHEDSQKQVESFALPVLKSYTAKDEYLNSYLDGAVVKYDKSVFVNAAKSAFNMQASGIYAEVNAMIGEEFNRIVLEDKDIDAAIADIQSKGTNLFNK